MSVSCGFILINYSYLFHLQCKQFVDEYSTMIIQLLSQELSPKQLCTSLGLCRETIDIKKTQMSNNQMRHSNGEVCDICTTVITYLKNLLQDNSTEVRIKQSINQSINQPNKQTTKQTNNQPWQPTRQPSVSRSVVQSFSRSVSRSVGRSVS